MPQAHFEIYRSQVFELASTLVVKSVASALTINNELKMLGRPVNDEDFRSWKYFMNLAGKYHSFDTMMSVVSLDTLQTIEFTVENLQIHRATAAAYVHGTRYYKELVQKYPEQESLILGILNPVDIDEAIAAEDGAILWYDKSLVEDNETNLIPKLQSYIDNVYARWNVSAYQISDELYMPAFLAMLYGFLPIAIMNIRNANCHTRYAHSFHIREFLTSHGKLNEFLDYLTKKQMLWLYRNIRYIQRNPGKQDTLDWLIDNILTPRRIPLSEWDMTHNLEGMPDDLYPKVEFVRAPMNLGQNFAGADTKTIEEMLDDEQPMAPGNIKAQPMAEIAIREQMESSIRNEYKTKVLESAMLDLTDSDPFNFHSFLLNHWLYLSNIGMYNSFVTFDDPRSGEPTSLPVKDAFTIFLYAVNKQYGIILPTPPTIEADLVRKIPRPTRSELEALTEPGYITSEILDALDTVPNVGTHISIAGFRDNMRECFQGLLRQRFVWAQQEHYRIRGQAEIAGLYYYHDYAIDLSEGASSYQEWFAERGYPYLNYNEFECELLANLISEQAVGDHLDDTMSLREVQAALIRLVAKLSSYSIQFLKKINMGSIKVIDWNVPKIGDVDIKDSAHLQANLCNVTVMSLLAESKALELLSIYDLGTEMQLSAGSKGSAELELNTKLKPYHRTHVTYRVPLANLQIRKVVEDYDDFEQDTPIRETNQYVSSEYQELENAFASRQTDQYSLTPQNRQSIELRWLEYLQNGEQDIDENIQVNILDGVRFDLTNWPAISENMQNHHLFGLNGQDFS